MTLDSCNNLEVDRNLKSKRTIKKSTRVGVIQIRAMIPEQDGSNQTTNFASRVSSV